MANPKGLKTWRRESLAYRRTDDEREEMATAYRNWLVKSKGWLTCDVACDKCRETGKIMPDVNQSSSWKRRRKVAGLNPWLTLEDRIDCPRCDGKGRLPCNPPIPDMERVNKYISAQRDELEQRAEQAIQEIETRLCAAGSRRVIAYARLPAMNATDRAELANLYHTARIPLAGQRDSDGRSLDTPYQRKLIAARWFHKKHPEISEKRAYLAFEES